MSQRAVLVGVSAAALAAAIAAAVWWHRRPTPVGLASGELSFRGHTGIFQLHPTFCRKAVAGRGAGLYDSAAPALAFGYFDDLDGGEWVEAQGPGTIGATRFDREDCTVFEATASLAAGLSSGHVEVVCEAPKSPGVTQVEGEVWFWACGVGASP